jgi:LPXTG-motif cell wall-anchored protein
MMRRYVAGAVIALVVAAPASALAQSDEGATPTTVITEATTVERDVTLTTTETRELDTDDDDDSDKTGLWGLLGLLGLAGLAGLGGRKRRDDDYVSGTRHSTTVQGDTTPRGSTSKP